MSDESDVDDLVHRDLLDEILELDDLPTSAPKKAKRLKLKKASSKVELNDLLGTIKSTR